MWHLFDKLQLLAKGEVMMLDNLAADANNTAGIDNQFINGNSLIDAIAIQLGLLGSY